MNTWSVCAAMGLGLCLASLSCSSSDSDKNDAGGRRDSGGNRDGRFAADAPGGCTAPDGRTYQPGDSFTINCVRYTCQGNDNVTTSGTPCGDASLVTPDARRDAAPDRLIASDVRADGAEVADARDAAADGNRDVVAAEAAGSDALGLEVTAPDGLADVTPPADVVPPVDEAPPVQCTYLGQKYGVGVPFACECNTCKCDSSGTIVLVTHNDCTIDAQ